MGRLWSHAVGKEREDSRTPANGLGSKESLMLTNQLLFMVKLKSATPGRFLRQKHGHLRHEKRKKRSGVIDYGISRLQRCELRRCNQRQRQC